jgi:hypothetical protein
MLQKILLSAAMLFCSTWLFAQDNSMSSLKKTDLLPNIVAIAPVQSTENGWGLGLSYEHMLDKKGILSFYGNLYASFNTESNAGGSAATVNPMYYISPGLKLYPTTCNGKVKYAVGPSFVAAFGKETDYDNYLGLPNTENRFTLGVLVNNSVNFSPSAHIYACLEFGFGWSYINTLGGVATTQKGLAQFAFKIGYRY